MKTFELSYISNGKCSEIKKGNTVEQFIHILNEWLWDIDITSSLKSRRMEPGAYKYWVNNSYIKVVVDGKEIEKTNTKWWEENFITNEDGMIVESKEEKYIKARGW